MKEIFTYNADINKTAYLNWRTDKHDALGNMISLAEGYYKSALKLAETLISDNRNKDADVIIFPMLFSVNHAIELYLKVLMWEFNIMMEREEKFERHHDIKQLYNVVISRMTEFEIDKERRKEFKRLTAGLKSYLDELFEKIKLDSDIRKDSMDFSRYPFNTAFDNHFYTRDYNNKVVDLQNFHIRFKEICENLDTIATHYLYDHIQYQWE